MNTQDKNNGFVRKCKVTTQESGYEIVESFRVTFHDHFSSRNREGTRRDFKEVRSRHDCRRRVISLIFGDCSLCTTSDNFPESFFRLHTMV